MGISTINQEMDWLGTGDAVTSCFYMHTYTAVDVVHTVP